MFAYDYPLLGVFWSMLMFFLWFAWIVLLFRVFGDIFRNRSMSGFGKALWSIFVIMLPFLGVFVYLIANGQGMGERDVAQAREADEAFRSYVRDAARTTSTVDDLQRLAELNRSGVLTDAEFQQQKAKLLA